METQTLEDSPTRRRPWTATFLSLVMPGLGHVYCGHIQNGIVIMLTVTMFSCVWLVGIVHPNTPFVGFTVAVWSVLLLVQIVAIIDSYRKALRTRYDYSLKDYNHWSTYLMLLWIAGAGSMGYSAFVKHTMFEAFRIPVNTMAPTISAGNRVLVSKMAYRSKMPERGDIVIFKNPMKLSQTNIKRIVAMGRDTVEVKAGQLIINGVPLQQDRIAPMSLPGDRQSVQGHCVWETNGNARYRIFLPDQKEPLDWGPITVPPHHCFVMSDARHQTYDSRHYGALSLGAIGGKFQTVYWPPRGR